MRPSLRARFDSLEGRRKALLGELATLSRAQGSFRPAPSGAWSILEVVHHLVLVEQGIVWALQHPPDDSVGRRSLRDRLGYAAVWLALTLGLRVRIPTERVRPMHGLLLSQLTREWAATRTSLEACLSGVTGPKLEEMTYRHPVAGPMSVAQTLDFLARHFEHHVRQIHRIRRSGGLPASPGGQP